MARRERPRKPARAGGRVRPDGHETPEIACFGALGAGAAIPYPGVMRRCIAALSLALLACDRTPAPEVKPAAPAPAPEHPMTTPTSTPPPAPVASGRTSNLKDDEEARIFPAIGKRDGDVWTLRVHGWVYEPETDAPGRTAAIEALRVALGLPDEAASSDIFRARARSFLVDNESSKGLLVRIGGHEYELSTTGSNGHTHTDLRVPADGLTPDAAGLVKIDVIPRQHDVRSFAGVALMLGETGVSVISDIDDTVKISEVRDKKKLLINTFMREFQPVPGMADAYRRWAAAGAAFHYVSASPWQLYDPIDGFFRGTGFPQGSLHLKQFRAKDSSFLSLFTDPLAYKGPILRELLTQFPNRKFVLVGDSGEMDPEVYGSAYREFPAQIVAIHIRDVTAEDRNAPRYAVAFADVPAERWNIFTDATTLPDKLE
jgi:hypothetical protein